MECNLGQVNVLFKYKTSYYLKNKNFYFFYSLYTYIKLYIFQNALKKE